MKLSIPNYIQEIKPYPPGKPIEEVEREYGIKKSIKLASNENPLGPSPNAVKVIQDSLTELHRYPDSHGFYLLQALSRYFNLPVEMFVLGNGSDEIITLLSQILLVPGTEVIMPKPSFLMYEINVRASGATPIFSSLKDLKIDLEDIQQKISPHTRIIFLTNPNNPTGMILTKDILTQFLNTIPKHVVVVLDEAYFEFVQNPDCASGIDYLQNDYPLVVLRTFSKAYGLAGLRIGYGIMPETLAHNLHRIRQPFNTNSLAQKAAIAALSDSDFLTQTKNLVHEGIRYITDNIAQLGLTCFPTQSNFMLIDTQQNADDLFEKLLKKGIIIRSMSSYGYPKYIRVNMGTMAENQKFLTALKEVL